MSGSDPLAPVARLARRIPGYPLARRVLVPRVRGNAVFRAVAHKLWVTEVAPDGRGADLTAGNVLGGVGLESIPVVLFVLAGVPASVLESVVDEIATIQLMTAGFRPVLLLDRADFASARKYGFAAELIPPEPGAPLENAALENVQYWQRLRRTYGTTLVCDVGPEGLSAAQRALLLSLVKE